MEYEKTQLYPTDLTDRQWDCIKDLIPSAKPGGRPRTLQMRAVVNAILYLVMSGCQWHMLLRAYPAWQSVYTYFQQWRDDGSGPRIHDTLRAQVCQKAGRHQLVLRSQGQKGFVVLPRRSGRGANLRLVDSMSASGSGV